jgi:large subunit ribosomal protein L18e
MKMVKRTGPTNPYLKQLIEALNKKSYESKAPIWKTIAKKLAKPTRQRISVNLSDIDRNTNNDDTIIVPGAVLATGTLSKSINIAAWKFSDNAVKKIKDVKGKIFTIEQLMKENPKGSGVKIIS